MTANESRRNKRPGDKETGADSPSAVGRSGPALTDRAYNAIAETFRALADPTRARIVHLLSFGESSVNDLAARLTVTPSAVSHQLRMLRQMGLVRFRREGQQALYTLDDPHVAILFRSALEHVGDYLKGTSAHRDSVAPAPRKGAGRP